MYNTLMIVNLESGRANFNKKLAYIIEELKYNEFDVTIKYTKKDYGADKIIADYRKEYDLLIVCGGDGTLNQAITGLTKLRNRVSIGFIPIGTTNDFARTLGIPKRSVLFARNLINTKALKTDTGIFNGKYFNYVVAFGAFTEVAYKTKKSLKRKLGWFAYLISSIKQFRKIRPYRLHIEFEDGKILEDNFIYGAISNSSYIGGIKWFDAEDFSLNDGKFEVILIKKPENFTDYLKIFKSILFKDYTNNKNIFYTQEKKLKISSEKLIEWTIDGEDAGCYKIVEIGNKTKNMEFLVL